MPYILTAAMVLRILSMALIALHIVILTVCPQASAQGEGTDASQGTVGPAAIWQPGGALIRHLGEACPQGGECFVEEMIKAAAPSPAVQFTRFLIDRDYPFCFMRSFQEMGKVDLVKVDCPFMANTMGFTLLVNGTPPVLALGDQQYLNAIDLKKDPAYAKIVRKYAQAQIWSDGAFISMKRLADGGQRFIWKHKLLNGCRACEYAGSATVAYDFDREGCYGGVKLLKLHGN